MAASTAADLLAQLEAEQRDVEAKLKEQQQKVRDKYRDKLNARLTELQAAYDEYQAVENALQSLDGNRRAQATAARGKGTSSVAGGKAAKQFARAVKDNPGKTVTELARVLGRDKPNYLYRISAELVKTGVLRKEGKGFALVDESYTHDGGSATTK